MTESKKITEADLLSTLNGGESIPLGIENGTTAVRTTIQIIADYVAKSAELGKLISDILDSFGDVEAESLNISTPHKVCGFPTILYGAGAPSSSLIPTNWDEETMGVWSGFPCFVGQLYINTSASSGGLYYAVNTGAVTDWKNA